MIIDDVKKAIRSLFPTGRAFRLRSDSYMGKLVDGLSESWARAFSDAKSIYYSILPDNDNFSSDDATDWERRLGIASDSSIPLNDRKLTIARKLNHPGDIKARQHYLFLQKQLRAAGFDVYVHENRFTYGGGVYYQMSPKDIDPSYPIIYTMHSNVIQHGQVQHGGNLGNKVANHIKEGLDANFGIGNNFKFTFFIGGPYLGTYASVPTERKDQLRQIILATKPVNTIAFLFINFN